MNSRQTLFFADKEDLVPIIEMVESMIAINYYQTGMFMSPEILSYQSLLERETLGYVTHGDWNHSASFLMIPSGMKLDIRTVPQRAGGVRYAVDQAINPLSVVIKPSGILSEGVFVAGMLGTISNEEFSLRLFKMFSNEIKKQFSRIGRFYIGPHAKIKLESGWRFVTNERSPKEYDITNE